MRRYDLAPARPSQQDSTFGRMNGTLNPRYLQLALRVNF
jgi:hypothetical protein